MQEESRWRYGLAQQIAPHAHANPNVAAVLIEGSVARDAADRSFDLDLAVFWTEPPTAQERRDIVPRAGGSSKHPWPSHREAAGWETRNFREGVPIDVRHMTVSAIESLLAALVERADLPLSKQRHLAALRFALPLVNPTLIKSGSSKRRPIRTTWRRRWYGNTCASAPPGSRNSWRSATRCWSSTIPSVPPRSSSCSSYWGSTTSTILAGGGWIGSSTSCR